MDCPACGGDMNKDTCTKCGRIEHKKAKPAKPAKKKAPAKK